MFPATPSFMDRNGIPRGVARIEERSTREACKLAMEFACWLPSIPYPGLGGETLVSGEGSDTLAPATEEGFLGEAIEL
jgi:hypothetical protein